MNNSTDGGYYAIKGFLYQFDKTLIEILKNPGEKIRIEQKQDIDYQDFVIQVKHKETQNYSTSKIRNPVIQLIDLFKEDKTQKFCLYCYFKDKSPYEWKLSVQDLDKILGDKKSDYMPYLKKEFVKKFIIHFSEDFETQFLQLIELIQQEFFSSTLARKKASDQEKAYIYHSIFRSKLLDIAIKEKEEREISKTDLSSFITAAEKTIFYGAYSKYLSKEKYEKLIKKEYFTFNTANIDNFERLVVIECNEGVNLVDINKIVNRISKKYFRKGSSPQPYLCFTNLKAEKLIELKQELADQGLMFNDGTYFNGDRFRLDKIIENMSYDDKIKVKIVDAENLSKILDKIKIKELFQFYSQSSLGLSTERKHIKIQIEETKQILKMI
jgi:hypothetical protein